MSEMFLAFSMPSVILDKRWNKFVNQYNTSEKNYCIRRVATLCNYLSSTLK